MGKTTDELVEMSEKVTFNQIEPDPREKDTLLSTGELVSATLLAMSIKSLGKESLIYGFGHVMARMVTFLLLPLYTHYFSPDQYGIISLSYAFIGFALIIYRYGMDTALMKYAVQETGLERKKHITVVLISQLITSLIFSLILYSSRKYFAPYIIGLDRPDWITFLSIILFLKFHFEFYVLIL